MHRPVCLEEYKDFKGLGRFMLRDKGSTIAAGIVLEVGLRRARALLRAVKRARMRISIFGHCSAVAWIYPRCDTCQCSSLLIWAHFRCRSRTPPRKCLSRGRRSRKCKRSSACVRVRKGRNPREQHEGSLFIVHTRTCPIVPAKRLHSRRWPP